MPTKTPPPVVATIVRAAVASTLGPVQIAASWDAGLDRARRADPVPAQPALPHRPGHRRTTAATSTTTRRADPRRRQEVRQHPRRRRAGASSARQQGQRNRHATRDRTGSRNTGPSPGSGTAYVHTVIDDHSRVAYAEIHDDEKADTAIGVLQRAVAWFADRGVTVERVLSDNGSAYKSHAWRDACAELGIRHKRTRPYRPQTNGKIERFHRTLADGWAYARLYNSEEARRAALPGWIHFYNHHRPHSAIGAPPITRLNNLPGHHT